MKGVEEMLSIFQKEIPDTGGASGNEHAIADEEERHLETTSTTESTTRGTTYHTQGMGSTPPQATRKTRMAHDQFKE